MTTHLRYRSSDRRDHTCLARARGHSDEGGGISDLGSRQITPCRLDSAALVLPKAASSSTRDRHGDDSNRSAGCSSKFRRPRLTTSRRRVVLAQRAGRAADSGSYATSCVFPRHSRVVASAREVSV